MGRWMRRQTGVAFAAVMFASMLAVAADPPARRILTTKECKQLVERLVNPGKAPFDGFVHNLPKGLSESGLRKSQQPIADAYNELSANIEQARTVLEAHQNDERFSYVYEEGISGVYECASVGRACSRILDEHINVYREPVTKRDEEGRRKSLWIEESKEPRPAAKTPGSTLADLQLEGIEWALRQTQPDYFTKQEWAKARESLEKMAGQIRETKKPIPVEHRVQFFSK
jgi:hypothetical protein